MKKKIFALIVAAVMCLGMSMTAFAATNDSPSVPNESPDVGDIYEERVFSNVKIAAGQGSVEKITDEDLQAIILERMAELNSGDTFKDYAYTHEFMFGEHEVSITLTPFISMSYGFDVQGIKSGQVTVQLQDQGYFSVSEYVGHLVYVSHYNTETGTWEAMDQFAQIDENGCVTFAFSSYSPVLLSVLNVTPENLETRVDQDIPVNILETTYEPQQVVDDDDPTGKPGPGGSDGPSGGQGTGGQTTDTDTTASTAPKTGDSVFGIVVLLVGAMAVCGAFLTRKKAA